MFENGRTPQLRDRRGDKLEKYRILHSNASQFVTQTQPGRDCQIFDEKISVVELRFWRNMFKDEDKHRAGVTRLLKVLLFLNPKIPMQNAFNWLCAINEYTSAYSLSEVQLVTVFETIWNNKDKALNPNKRKRAAFKADTKLTGRALIKEYAQAMAEKNRGERSAKIMEVLRQCDVAPSVKELASLLGWTRPTVYAYLKLEEVNEVWEGLREDIKDNQTITAPVTFSEPTICYTAPAHPDLDGSLKRPVFRHFTYPLITPSG